MHSLSVPTRAVTFEYFKYMIDMLRDRGRSEIRVFGGGGGVIVSDEIEDLHAYGVARIFSPADGQRMGLNGMIYEMIKLADRDLAAETMEQMDGLFSGQTTDLARVITALEQGRLANQHLRAVKDCAEQRAAVPVLGITGTGGAGKSSLTDELIRRFRLYSDEPRIAVIAIDPSRRKTGGALLGDRIRMNAISSPNIFMRSLATRGSESEVPSCNI